MKTKKPTPIYQRIDGQIREFSSPEEIQKFLIDRANEQAVKPEPCPYCGTTPDDEELKLLAAKGRLTCPQCDREGCYNCMPSGRGCCCPECEDAGP